MDSRELAAAMAKAAGIDMSMAKKALAAISQAIVSELRTGGTVRLGSIGTFKMHKQPARTYRHPKTGVQTHVPAKRTIKFQIARGKKQIKG